MLARPSHATEAVDGRGAELTPIPAPLSAGDPAAAEAETRPRDRTYRSFPIRVLYPSMPPAVRADACQTVTVPPQVTVSSIIGLVAGSGDGRCIRSCGACDRTPLGETADKGLRRGALELRQIKGDAIGEGALPSRLGG